MERKIPREGRQTGKAGKGRRGTSFISALSPLALHHPLKKNKEQLIHIHTLSTN
jgi:hypothetical protein